MNIGRFIKAATLVATSTLIASSALAAPPHTPDMVTGGNRWQLSGYDDSNPNHTQGSVQTLCFFNVGVAGTHQRYRWVSTTFGGWDGLATQEGDQLFMHGDFNFPAPNAGHDSIEVELATVGPKASEAYGHWREWLENDGTGLTLVWNNVKLTRTGTCTQKTAAEAMETARTAVPVDSTGAPLLTPSGIDPAVAAAAAAEIEGR